MKKFSTYLVSLIMSIILVFMIIATSVMTIIHINVTESKSVQLFEKKQVYSLIIGELQKYFVTQYNTTGIPADIYMEALDEDYIRTITNGYVNAVFSSLTSGKSITFDLPENETLENNIRNFFSEYADKNNYEKDEIYEKKISSTIENAYRVMGNYCDVYKYSTLSEHGVLSKISKIFSRFGSLMTISIVATVFVVILLIIANIKEISCVLYWTGISAVIAGIFGTVPTAWLLGVDYFDSFVIKQPQMFKAFTGAMYAFTGTVMEVHILLMCAGICLIIIYNILCKSHKK
ncbi:MAG: hypothetical protein NC244_01445 [Alistipes senegalensis]|nr:hypothetical protein [Alistipes senegalensis]